jgi:glycosyltransferase involved in cell wall biosynthesis
MTRALVISAEPVGSRMLGSAIRAYELAKVLAAHAEVTLAYPDDDADRGASDLPAALKTIPFDRARPTALAPELARAGVVVTQPPWPHVAAALRRSGARLVFDLYDPEPVENLELHARRPAVARRAIATLTLDRYAAALRSGHHLMCASEAQRALYLGMLLAERLLPPVAYDADPTQRSRLDVVPFGVPDAAPRQEGPGPRDLLPGVGADAELVLWNGGIWPWLDAASAIRAIAALAQHRPRVRLVVMGAASAGPGRAATLEARRVAGELGVLGRIVHFHDEWVPYEQRASWLLQADCAISTHRDHLETTFAFRTRVLDCFWAGLPVVLTEGDALSARVARDDLGATAAPGDVEALAAGLARVLDRGRAAYADALRRARDELAWSRVAAPLVAWASNAGRPPPRLGAPRAGATARDVAFRAGLEGARLIGLGRWRRL